MNDSRYQVKIKKGNKNEKTAFSSWATTLSLSG